MWDVAFPGIAVETFIRRTCVGYERSPNINLNSQLVPSAFVCYSSSGAYCEHYKMTSVFRYSFNNLVLLFSQTFHILRVLLRVPKPTCNWRGPAAEQLEPLAIMLNYMKKKESPSWVLSHHTLQISIWILMSAKSCNCQTGKCTCNGKWGADEQSRSGSQP